MRKKVPYVEQMNQTECGLCCCLSILQHYGSKESLLDLRRTMECGRDGYSLKKLSSLMESRGMVTASYGVKRIEALQKLPLPFLAFWDKEHYVVVYKLTKKAVYIMNPARGYETYRYEEAEEHFSGAVMVTEPGEAYRPRKSSVKSPWLQVGGVLLSNKLHLGLAVLFAVVNYLVMLKVPALTSSIIDEAVNANSFTNILTFMKILSALLLLYFVSLLVRSFSIMLSNIFFSEKIEKNTFRHLLRLPYKFFELRTSGDILYRVTSLSAFRELFTTQVVTGIVDLGTIAFILYFLFAKSVPLTFLVLALSLFNVIFLIVTKRPISQSINKEVVEQSEMQAVENESLFTISSIKISGMEEQIFDNWYGHMRKVMSCYKQRYSLNNVYSAVTSTFQIFAPIVILVFGIRQYYAGNLSFGEVVAYESLASMLFSAEVSVFCSYTQFVLAHTYLKRVNDIWCEEEEKRYSKELEVTMTGQIRVEKLCFSYYRDSAQVLHNISMNIKAGERVAFVGKSGSGKSTMGKVIAGLYAAEQGKIYYDGVDMNDIKKSSLCSQIGMVPQEVYLLNRSIRENILNTETDEASEEEMYEVCRAVRIYDEIMEMPMGFQTIVSEMGLNLSGGQRQRIALARALVHKPKVVILDEATSALDTVNEKGVTEYLKRIGCTQIIIAHRLSTIIDADRIYVFKDGKIAEEGTHKELMRHGKEYYSLYMNCEEEKDDGTISEISKCG